MNVNKIKIFILLILFVFVINIEIPVHASMIEDIWQQGSDFLKMGKESDTPTFNGQNMKDATDNLYSLFWWAGVAIAVIVGAFLGIKFMTESVEGKAKIKEALIPFALGCVVIFGSFSIWKIAMNLFSDMEKAESKTVSTQQYFKEKCANGEHTYDNANDFKCNACGEECHHVMAQRDKTMYCTNTNCKYKRDICNYMGNGNHNFANGTCKICGYQCKHQWESINKYNHKCEWCKNSEPHIWDGGDCTKCHEKCAHKYYEFNGKILCSNCSFSKDLCTKSVQAGGLGKDQHNYSINWYGGKICSYCYAPDPDNPPQY